MPGWQASLSAAQPHLEPEPAPSWWLLVSHYDGVATDAEVVYRADRTGACCGPLPFELWSSVGAGTLPHAPILTAGGDCGPCDDPPPDPGAPVVTTCGTLTENLTATFGGTLAGMGAVPITWNAVDARWENAEIANILCGQAAAKVLFECTGLGVWQIAYGTIFLTNSATTSFSASASGLCAGAATVVVA